MNIEQGSLKAVGGLATETTLDKLTPATAATAPVVVSVGSSTTTIVAANSSRKFVMFQNVGSQKVFYRFSATATTSDLQLHPTQTAIVYATTVVNGIVASGTANVVIVEFS